MTAEARSAAAPPDQARSPAAVAYPPGQRRRSGHTSRSHRAPTRTSTDPVRDDSVVIDLVTAPETATGRPGMRSSSGTPR